MKTRGRARKKNKHASGGNDVDYEPEDEDQFTFLQAEEKEDFFGRLPQSLEEKYQAILDQPVQSLYLDEVIVRVLIPVAGRTVWLAWIVDEVKNSRWMPRWGDLHDSSGAQLDFEGDVYSYLVKSALKDVNDLPDGVYTVRTNKTHYSLASASAIHSGELAELYDKYCLGTEAKKRKISKDKEEDDGSDGGDEYEEEDGEDRQTNEEEGEEELEFVKRMRSKYYDALKQVNPSLKELDFIYWRKGDADLKTVFKVETALVELFFKQKMMDLDIDMVQEDVVPELEDARLDAIGEVYGMMSKGSSLKFGAGVVSVTVPAKSRNIPLELAIFVTLRGYLGLPCVEVFGLVLFKIYCGHRSEEVPEVKEVMDDLAMSEIHANELQFESFVKSLGLHCGGLLDVEGNLVFENLKFDIIVLDRKREGWELVGTTGKVLCSMQNRHPEQIFCVPLSCFQNVSCKLSVRVDRLKVGEKLRVVIPQPVSKIVFLEMTSCKEDDDARDLLLRFGQDTEVLFNFHKGFLVFSGVFFSESNRDVMLVCSDSNGRVITKTSLSVSTNVYHTSTQSIIIDEDFSHAPKYLAEERCSFDIIIERPPSPKVLSFESSSVAIRFLQLLYQRVRKKNRHLKNKLAIKKFVAFCMFIAHEIAEDVKICNEDQLKRKRAQDQSE